MESERDRDRQTARKVREEGGRERQRQRPALSTRSRNPGETPKATSVKSSVCR